MSSTKRWAPAVRAASLLIAALLVLGCAPEEPGWTLEGDGGVRALLDRDACQACVSFEELVRIGDNDGPGILVGASRSVAVTREGHYVIPQGDHLKVFDGSGDFVRTIGREGRGPGEFINVVDVIQDDSGNIHAFDNLSLRRTLFDLDLELVRMDATPAMVYNASSVPGTNLLLLNMPMYGPELVGYPAHLVDAMDLQRTRSLGLKDGEVVDIRPGQSRRSMAADARGRLYLGDRGLQTIEVWSADGRLLATLVLPDAPEGRSMVNELSRETPPPSSLMGIHVDASNRLWAITWVARSDWAENLTELTLPSGRVILQPEFGNRSVFSARISVIDPERGVVIATVNHDNPINGFIGDSIVFGEEYTDLGAPQVAFWSVELSGL